MSRTKPSNANRQRQKPKLPVQQLVILGKSCVSLLELKKRQPAPWPRHSSMCASVLEYARSRRAPAW